MSERNHYYKDVPGLGPVAVSRHAQDRMDEQGISGQMFESALFSEGADLNEEPNIRWREKDGIRVVIIERPEPFRGAKLIKTVIKVGGQENAKKFHSR